MRAIYLKNKESGKQFSLITDTCDYFSCQIDIEEKILEVAPSANSNKWLSNYKDLFDYIETNLRNKNIEYTLVGTLFRIKVPKNHKVLVYFK